MSPACTAPFEPTINTAMANVVAQTRSTMAASLVNIYPPNTNVGLIQLPAKRFIIGRDSHSDLWLDDPSISRQQASLERTEKGVQLTDHVSTNGSYVNDHRVTTAIISAGDQLRFGNHIFKVLGANDIEAQFLETVYTRMVRDGLTGAYNKRYLVDALEREVNRARRHNRPLSIAILDIDHFKAVNDTFGHLIGDEVLKEFSRRLLAHSRQDDIFARYGGEEFIAVFAETTLDQARTAAESFRQIIANTPFATAAGSLPITVSIGVASMQGNELPSSHDLIAAADKCLYAAKRAGRNRVGF
ncbi:diguanylate cyclase [Anatilimnocola floriformis]|uniref:diguanylate cyclase n=1 Tax=Anatilimnocola floriformis TaxID=2948575 RepID=UPI0020C52A35|nr:GGDEF domain-containing protein [Anatilimnocola floriformis]